MGDHLGDYMLKRFILLTVFTGFSICLQAQAMSLTTGNAWNFHWFSGPDSGTYTITAIGDTLINGHVYQQIGSGFFRCDSSQVFTKNTINSPEYLLYDLNWELDQQVNINGMIYTVTDKGIMNFFQYYGLQYIIVYWGNEYDYTTYTFTEVFGQIYKDHWDFMSEFGYTKELIGAQIDNTIYGTIVSSDDVLVEQSAILLQNYPNPFNPSTTIEFSIQNDSKVELSIYTIKGQTVKTLVNNYYHKGNHSIMWNGNDDSDELVSSGIYFYKLKMNGKTEVVKKCLLLK